MGECNSPLHWPAFWENCAIQIFQYLGVEIILNGWESERLMGKLCDSNFPNFWAMK